MPALTPTIPEAPDQLEHAVKQLGLRGLKIGPIYQGYDPLSDGALAMFAKADALSIPIMWHQGTTFVRKGAAQVRSALAGG